MQAAEIYLEYETVVVKHLTYVDAAKRGVNYQVYQWAPHTLVSFEQFQKEREICREEWCGPNHNWFRREIPLRCIIISHYF